MSDDEHDSVHLNPGTTQVQAQARIDDDDEPQTDTPSSPRSADQEDQASPDDSAGEEGPGSTMEEEAPQGGGGQGAAVIKTGKFRSFHLTQSPDTDRISKVTWYYEGNTHVTKKRPADGAPDSALWMLMEMQTAKAKKFKADSEALTKVEQVLHKHRTLKDPVGAPAPAAPAGNPFDPNAATVDAEADSNRYKFTITDMPMPDTARSETERRWFLQVVEDTKAPDGRPFAPYGKSGSLCGLFPHLIMQPSRSKYGTQPVYAVSQHHRIGLRVQLMEIKPGATEATKASEFELLKWMQTHYTQAQWAKFGHYEKSLTVYAYLEFSGCGQQVQADCFKLAPPQGAMWSPPESPPYHAGSTERVMEGGYVNFRKLWLNKRVTTANLDEEVPEYQFRIVIKTLNPILHNLRGFTAKSSPFIIKAVKHNDVYKKQRFVRTAEGQVVPLA